MGCSSFFFFFQAEDGIRDPLVTGVQTCALPILLVTRGEAGIAGMPPDKVAPLRVEEERRSAAVVGVTEVEFLDHPYGLVEYGIALRRDLAAAIRRLQPQVVIGMSFDLTWGEEGPV